jgi:hypothetical protein
VTLQHQYKQIVISSGTLLHPSYWPQEELHLTGKRVAIVGTGSTGVQLATELSKVTSHLTVFQRTPNMALPMRQVQYNPPTQALPREAYPDLFSHRKDSFSGFSFSFIPRTTFADTAEQRRQVYEKLWAEGDFQFWLATYCDMLFDREAMQRPIISGATRCELGFMMSESKIPSRQCSSRMPLAASVYR